MSTFLDRIQAQTSHPQTTTDLPKISYLQIAQALAQDYISIYYVNTDTDAFVEYSSSRAYKELQVEQSGEDFFNVSIRNIKRVVYPEDQEMAISYFQKDWMLSQLAHNPEVSFIYRLMYGDNPVYINIKALRLEDDENHIVVAISNIDAEIRRQQAYEREREKRMAFSRIAQALAQDYFTIYQVDLEDDSYIEYSSQKAYQQLKIEEQGERFFETCRRNIERVIHPEDRTKLISVFHKEWLLKELEEEPSLSVAYRLIIDQEPLYVSLKAIRMKDEKGLADRYLLIGVRNVDAQIRLEQRFSRELSEAREAAYKDSLTGVKSKHAYAEFERELDEKIDAQGAPGFAVVVCDVNGLKQVNDTQGHVAGDRYIQEGCHMICEIFQHSPVFRVGGDEFVAVLQGADYVQREQLLWMLRSRVEENKCLGKVCVACGMDTFVQGKDRKVAEVFHRADEQMYENKHALKNEA